MELGLEDESGTSHVQKSRGNSVPRGGGTDSKGSVGPKWSKKWESDPIRTRLSEGLGLNLRAVGMDCSSPEYSVPMAERAEAESSRQRQW